MKFTIGADPELFVQDDVRLRSIIDKLGGTKEDPLPLARPGCAVQEDNVAAEFNIPPCATFEEFNNSIEYVLGELEERMKSMGLQLARHVASHSFHIHELADARAFVFGCDPDINAWTKELNPKPHCEDETLRSAGGHVHIGTDLPAYPLIQACDLFLGVPSLALDQDTKRRELYGKAGACRVKPYGVEYRTLSNFWIWTPEMRDWCYRGTEKAVRFVSEGNTIGDELGKLIQAAINQQDVAAYNAVMEVVNAA